MKVFLAALLLVGICVLGMCFNILFRKNGEFPEYEVSKNREMRKLGIRCMHEQDEDIHGKHGNRAKDHNCNGQFSDACKGCSFYKE